jgi:hypothetical protein
LKSGRQRPAGGERLDEIGDRIGTPETAGGADADSRGDDRSTGPPELIDEDGIRRAPAERSPEREQEYIWAAGAQRVATPSSART